LKCKEQIGGRNGVPDTQGEVAPGCLARDYLGSTGESSQMVTHITVVALDMRSTGFTDDMAIRGQDLSEDIPSIGVIDAMFQVFDFVIRGTSKNP
jgi:hypothetical protein